MALPSSYPATPTSRRPDAFFLRRTQDSIACLIGAYNKSPSLGFKNTVTFNRSSFTMSAHIPFTEHSFRQSHRTRSRKSGDQVAVELRLERRWDQEEELGTPIKIAEWINKVLGNEPGFQPLPIGEVNGSSWQILQNYVRDGVVLCQLLNILRENAGMPKIGFKSKAKVAFVAMSNVSGFNEGAEEYGVPKTATFQTSDVMDGRKGPMIHVLNCLCQLGFVANQRGFEPSYEPVAPPRFED